MINYNLLFNVLAMNLTGIAVQSEALQCNVQN